MINSEDGFTLLESLFVLSVFLIIASISAFVFKSQFVSLEKQQFISQLRADLLYGQQYAMSHQVLVTVNILPEENSYYLREGYNKGFLIKREIPEVVTIKEGSMKLFFQFKPDGNINRFGSFLIKVDKVWYRMTFLIGKGRFYVAKE
ncbi:competence type IV pilus minor pilin ComGD [Cytobacillus massiliigabonensis]|uniref:competence type IV pilus minor pilin ComGD n=1 Tax=Cytobacillus massiliigabonensis TaxID=1871011 RepID=UPI000C82AD76|nr:competence type IV pilus minor pilin ComGD [Cytobacillus massiliigabonensis]